LSDVLSEAFALEGLSMFARSVFARSATPCSEEAPLALGVVAGREACEDWVSDAADGLCDCGEDAVSDRSLDRS
jgi:hypothetical protein